MSSLIKERDILLFDHFGKDGKIWRHPVVVFYKLKNSLVTFQVTDRMNFNDQNNPNEDYKSFQEWIYLSSRPKDTFYLDEEDGFDKPSQILTHKFYEIESKLGRSASKIRKVGVMKNKEKFEKIKNIIEDRVRLRNGDISPLIRWK